MMENVRIHLYDNTFLVAEQNEGLVYKELYIGIEKDGVWIQDLATVREKYHYDDNVLHVVHDHGEYEVLVYADKEDEDYTHKFVIGEYREE